MEQHGLLTWRSSEADKPGEEQGWSLGRRLDKDAAEKFAKAAGIRNADQVDMKFLQRSYEASLRPGLQDTSARIADMDAAGVAAAVIFHGGLNGQSIPFSTTGLIAWGDSRYNHLEPVGVRIYNRWLADFVAEAPERTSGSLTSRSPIPRPACARSSGRPSAGLKGINLPAPRGDFPMLNDPVWEPLWAACEATGMSLNTHGGGGEHYPYKGQGAQAMYMMETPWRTRRGVWVMILGGVFDRHPGLKLVLTEQWIDWAVAGDRATWTASTTVRPALAARDASAATVGVLPARTASSAPASSRTGRRSSAIEHDLVANTMWGDDYPHAEGTWPHTREAMRFTFSDIDQKHVAAVPRRHRDRRVRTRPRQAARRSPPRSARPSPRSPRRARPPRTRRSASTRSAPVRGSSLMSDVRRSASVAVPVGHRRRGRAPPRARLGAS